MCKLEALTETKLAAFSQQISELRRPPSAKQKNVHQDIVAKERKEMEKEKREAEKEKKEAEKEKKELVKKVKVLESTLSEWETRQFTNVKLIAGLEKERDSLQLKLKEMKVRNLHNFRFNDFVLTKKSNFILKFSIKV